MMGNSQVGIWGKHGQGQGSKGFKVGARLAHLNDSKGAVAGEESERRMRVIRDEAREIMQSAHAGP